MKFKNLLILFIVISVFASCTFTEEIHFKKDGSGSYAFKMDMSKMMEAMGELGSENDSIKKDKKPEKRDTLIFFNDVLEQLKDSIENLSEEERDVMKSLKDLKMRIQMDEEDKQMNMDFIFDFKNIEELANINEKVQKAQSMSDKKKEKDTAMRDMFNSPTDVTFSFKNNVFKRQVTYKKELTQEQIDQQVETLSQSSDMFEESSYKIVYHFENEIKSVSSEHAKISDNGKTLTIEMPMDTIIKNPFLLNFEVKLK